jgi:hypothetical protein
LPQKTFSSRQLSTATKRNVVVINYYFFTSAISLVFEDAAFSGILPSTREQFS